LHPSSAGFELLADFLVSETLSIELPCLALQRSFALRIAPFGRAVGDIVVVRSLAVLTHRTIVPLPCARLVLTHVGPTTPITRAESTQPADFLGDSEPYSVDEAYLACERERRFCEVGKPLSLKVQLPVDRQAIMQGAHQGASLVGKRWCWRTYTHARPDGRV